MLYRSRGLWATANIKRAALQNKSDAFVLGRGTTSAETLCRFPPKGTCAYANPFTPFHFFLKSVVSKKKNCGEILAVLRVFRARTLTLLPPFTFFENAVFKKRTAVNTMTEQEKEQILRKMKNREQGDVASNDDDLVRSEKYMKKGQYARSKYKEFYDDVKLSIKEDW